jgi:peptide deformylase
MPIKKILTIDKHDKLLKTPSVPILKINKEIKQLIEDLKDTMADPDVPALGLAAPQIGVLKRAFGIYLGFYDRPDEDDGEAAAPLEATIFLNPEIVSEGDESAVEREGCLSIPGMAGDVSRKTAIKVRYTDENGVVVERDLAGDDAYAFQHELDHLDGILFLQRLKSLDDLYVYVRHKKGKVILAPYTKVVGQAQAAVNADTPTPPLTTPRTSKA